jgi:hypothetical protein
MMKMVCAWCHRPLTTTGLQVGQVSHGICLKCFEAVIEELHSFQQVRSGRRVGEKRQMDNPSIQSSQKPDDSTGA